MHQVLAPGYGTHRALPDADLARLALVGNYIVADQGLAHARGAAFPVDVGFILVTEMLYRAQHRIGRGLTQGTEGGITHHPGQLLQQLDVALLPFSFADPVQYAEHLPYALAARHALAAGLPGEEVEEIPGYVHHAGVLVHHDHAAGAHHRAGLIELIEIHREVEEAVGQNPSRRPAGLNRLEPLALLDAAPDIVDYPAQRHPHGHFHQAGVVHLADQGEYLGSLASLRPDAGEPVGSLVDYQGHIGPRFNVVQVARLAPDPADRGADVLRPRLAHLALDGVHQGAGFAGHEGAGAAVDGYIEAETGAEDVFTQQAVIPRLVEGMGEVFHG